jgi:hypothetical protein
MKKFLVIILAVFLTATLWAQSPEQMNYQAVIRDASDALVTNSEVGMRISILQGSVSGTSVYVETQSPTSNANGLVSVSIGGGTVVSGTFADIDWASGPYFIKTETDPDGGTSYSITGTSQLLSVPYALHAKTAETVTGEITETDPVYAASQAKNITAAHLTNLGNLSGINTGDQDLSTLATKTALGDSTAQVRSEIPDVSGFLTSETDPTFTSSQAANIDADDITNLGNLSGVNTGDQDLSTLATKTALGDSTAQVRSEIPIIPTGTATGDMQYWNGTAWITVTAGTTGQLLSLNASGIPEWQNPSSLKSAATQAPTMTAAGVTFNGMLNANDYSTTVAFEYGTTTSYGTTVVATQSPVSGTTNTAVTSALITDLTIGTTYHVRMITQNIFGTFYGDDIEFTYLYYGASYEGGLVFSIDNSGKHGLVSAPSDHYFNVNWAGAFTACSGTINGYDDWYLPSKSTLNLMYVNLKTQDLGGFVSDVYWSSTEYRNSYAWFQHFGNGFQNDYDKGSTFRVRAVRAF